MKRIHRKGRENFPFLFVLFVVFPGGTFGQGRAFCPALPDPAGKPGLDGGEEDVIKYI
jgi:hypothetical protein